MIWLTSEYRFCVYEHKIQKRKELASCRMIVLRNQKNRIARFTGLEFFSYPFSHQYPKITVRSKAELTYICNALNYIFSHNCVQRVADITADMVIRYFDAYCATPKDRSEEVMLSQQSLDNCEYFLPNSHEEVWWRCSEGHEWTQMIYERANGSKCPYCQERIPVRGETDLASRCPELTKRWDLDKNKKGPEEYFPDSTVPVYWKCEEGHSFRSPIREMVLRWRCPVCERQKTAPWRK